jgi:hypothetical protein
MGNTGHDQEPRPFRRREADWPEGLGWTLLTLAAIDEPHLVLPDVLTLPLIPAGLLVAYGFGSAGSKKCVTCRIPSVDPFGHGVVRLRKFHRTTSRAPGQICTAFDSSAATHDPVVEGLEEGARAGPLAEPDQLLLQRPEEPLGIGVALGIAVAGGGLADVDRCAGAHEGE